MNKIIEKLSEKELNTLINIANIKGLDEEASKSMLHVAIVDISLSNDEFSYEMIDYAIKHFANELYDMLKERKNEF